MSLLKELTDSEALLWEGEIDGHHFKIHETLNEGVSDLRFVAESSLVRKVTRAARKSPLTTAVIGLSLAGMAASAYNKSKRNTTHFYAKSPQEKKMYAAIVQDLMATGNYRLKLNAKYLQGGYVWKLVRK